MVALSAGGCGGDEPAAPQAAPQTPKPSAASPDADDVPITEADVARPKDYAEAVTRIDGYRDTIRDEIAAGRPTKAHRVLDELDIVLNWLPGIARDSDVPKEQWEAVNTTAQKIRGLFNQVHSRIDAKQEPDYGAVSNEIDEAIVALGAIHAAPATNESAVKP
jgi:3-oxoacyl-ACP reductase-like protein